MQGSVGEGQGSGCQPPQQLRVDRLHQVVARLVGRIDGAFNGGNPAVVRFRVTRTIFVVPQVKVCAVQPQPEVVAGRHWCVARMPACRGGGEAQRFGTRVECVCCILHGMCVV